MWSVGVQKKLCGGNRLCEEFGHGVVVRSLLLAGVVSGGRGQHGASVSSAMTSEIID